MLDITDKADSTAGATGELTAAEYNDHKNEIQTAVERSGQALSAGITDQFAKALFINGAGANATSDSGSINSIILSPVTGSPGLTVPNTYAELDGAILQFEKTTANTSTAVTVNFGQTGTELGAKSLVRKDSSLPVAGDVNGFCFIQWDNAADKWILLQNGANAFGLTVSSSGAMSSLGFMNRIIEFDASLVNISPILPAPDFVGQKLYVYTTGSGIVDIAGTGLYVNKVYQTSNTGILRITAISATDWRAENVVTAVYVSGSFNYGGGTDYRVKLFSDGNMKQQVRSVVTINAVTTIAFNTNFNNNDTFILVKSTVGVNTGTPGSSNEQLSVTLGSTNTITATDRHQQFRLQAAGIVANTPYVTIEFEGDY